MTKPNDAQSAIALAIQANVPTLIKDNPGSGKTSWLEALATHLNWPLETVNADQAEPPDITGVYCIDGGEVRRVPVRWACRLAQDAPRAGGGIIFFDDFHLAAASLQGPVMEIARTRRVGDMQLPRHLVRFVAVVNPPEAVGGYELTAPMANRLAHFDWTFDSDSWLARMDTGDFSAEYDSGRPALRAPLPVLPPDWRQQIPLEAAKIALALRLRRELVRKMPTDRLKQSLAWPSPRTWSMAARLRAAATGSGLESLVTMAAVGEAATIEFTAILRNLDLPDPRKAIADPTIIKEPGPDGDYKLHATLAGIVSVVASDPLPLWIPSWEALDRVAKWAPEIVAGHIPRLVSLRPDSIPATATATGQKLTKKMGKVLWGDSWPSTTCPTPKETQE